MKITSLFLLIFLATTALFAQNTPLGVLIEPVENATNIGGIQSFAYAQHNGKWLIISGRLDGLHQRMPFAAFDVDGNNNQLMVIDPETAEKWTAPLTSLSPSLQEQLSATNTQFFYENNYLYLTGGYGYSPSAGDHKTFEYITAANVPAIIEAVINGSTDFSTFFRQVYDENFAVTGGQLEKINNTFYLVGGHRFDGRYNPMGPDHGPGFSQEYTNEIRRFTLNDDGETLQITHLETWNDIAAFHRRDFNVLPKIMPNEEEGLVAFSGVFQVNADLPFLNCVQIDSANYSVNNDFAQYYNHYHCANIPLYSQSNDEMHYLFFGGIAQYYDSLGVMVQDNDIPFVRTIARISQTTDGDMHEYKLPVEMPSLLGAGSEFIANENLSYYNNGVLKLDELSNDTTFVGYIFGGISSTAPNIFWINDGTQSSTNQQLFKVFITKSPTSTHSDALNQQSNGHLQMQVYPNPNNGEFSLKFRLNSLSKVQLSLYDLQGNEVLSEKIKRKDLQIGDNIRSYQLQNLSYGSVYMLVLKTAQGQVVQKIIINPL